MFPEASKTFTPLIMVLAVISIIYGAFLAIGAKDIKRLIAYTSISHFGFITMGTFCDRLAKVKVVRLCTCLTMDSLLQRYS